MTRRFRPRFAHLNRPATADIGLPPPLPAGAPRPASRRRRVVLWSVLIGFLLGVLACGGLLAGVVYPMMKQAKNEALNYECTRNLSAIYLAMQVYSRENRGHYPPLSAEPGRFMVDAALLAPDYIVDRGVFQCPAISVPAGSNTPPAMDDSSYLYLSHAILDEAEAKAFLQAYRDRMAQGLPMDGDITVNLPDGGEVHLRKLRSSVERFLASDPLDPEELDEVRRRVPVLLEWPGHHSEPGGNVVYLDGHTAFIPYPGPFPMTPDFIEALREPHEH